MKNRLGALESGHEPASHIQREHARQPDAWRAAVAAAADTVGLPDHGARVAVVGCGTSLYMAMAYAARREAAGRGETDAFAASEFPFQRRYDHVVAITRSGTTTEVLHALERLGDGPAPTTVLTVDPATPAGALAGHSIAMPMAVEQSVVQTVFPTSVLALLRTSLGDDLGPAIAQAEVNVTTALPISVDTEQITFLGRGWAAGIAHEAALKCREAAGFWTESYPSMEFRHGPISVSGPGRAVWVFGEPPAGLADAVSATGATLVMSNNDPMADLILAQRVAIALAHRAGRDPDRPRALAFSVVLPDDS